MNSIENIVIRKGVIDDLPQVHGLIRELAEFERAPEEVSTTVETMQKDGFGSNPSYCFFIAETENKIVGIAVYFIKYSTWKGKGLFLDDLIVTEKFRSRGIGKKLFDAVVAVAKHENAKQLHWQVLDWNTPAIDFYKKLGSSIEAQWLDCKLDEGQISRYINYIPGNESI